MPHIERELAVSPLIASWGLSRSSASTPNVLFMRFRRGSSRVCDPSDVVKVHGCRAGRSLRTPTSAVAIVTTGPSQASRGAGEHGACQIGEHQPQQVVPTGLPSDRDKPAKVKEATAAGICLYRFTAACGLWSIDFRKGSLDEQVSRSDRTAFRTTDGVGACAERQGRERALALHMRVRNEERNSRQRFDIW